MVGLWKLVFMYGYSPPSVRSLRPLPSGSPTTPLGASQTYSYFRVLCHRTGAAGAPPALPECSSSSLCCSRYEGVGLAADSAGLVLRQSSLRVSLRRGVPGLVLLCFFVVLAVPSGISGFTGFRGFLGFLRFGSILAVFLASGFTRISECGVTSHKSSTLSSHQLS